MTTKLKSNREKARDAKLANLKAPDISKCKEHVIPELKMKVWLDPAKGQTLKNFMERLQERKLRF